jgi:putative ABC transport system permease protein
MFRFWQDLRYGARLLSKAPGFAAVALIALALGMGATTAIFSVVDAVLLKPLPFRDPQRLLVLYEKNPPQNKYKLDVAAANFVAWRNQSRTLEQIAGIQRLPFNLTGGPNGRIDPEELRGECVSASLFPLLGVQPILGRAFREEEDQPGRTFIALLSYSLWQRRFGADRSIVGKNIRLHGESYSVAGVMPPGFAVMEPDVDVWVPLGLNSADARVANAHFLTVIARRKASLESVRAEFDAIGARMEAAMPALNRGLSPSVYELEDELVGGVRRGLWVLLAAVGCILLMACANVANLLLSRGASRSREIALRFALGAPRGRIVTQFLTESILLALGGGALGLLLGAATIRFLAHSASGTVPRLAYAAVDWRLFLFALASSLLTGALFGSIPAWTASTIGLTATLNEGGRGGTAGRSGRGLRNLLVASEIALAVVVLIAAGLLIRSFLRLRGAELGFQRESLLTCRIPLNAPRERRPAFVQNISDRVAGLPGVRSVGFINSPPLTGLGLGTAFFVEGGPLVDESQRPLALARYATPTYFHTMGIPLTAGRFFTPADDDNAPNVLIVNQALVRHFFTHENPLGRRLTLFMPAKRTGEIVGVVGDVKAESVKEEPWPVVYQPYPQFPAISMTLVVRAAVPPLSLAPAIQAEVHRLDPEQPVAEARTMDDVVGRSVSGERFNMALLSSFAAIAFTLASVGIYGVISYDVSQRINEIGIRMALGAQPNHLVRMVVVQGLRMAAYGIAAGLLLSVAVTRLMSTMLYGVEPLDPSTFAVIAILLAAVAFVASYLPSRRAIALDPVSALHHQ